MAEVASNPERSSEMPLFCELAGDSAHLIRARWAAGTLVFAATAFCVRVLGLPLPEGPLYAVGAFILGYNAVISIYARRIYPPGEDPDITRTRRLVLIQNALDWISMAFFLHLTGGVCSPAKPILLIHVLVVAILMSRQITLLFVILDVGTISLIAVLEHSHLIPHYSVTPGFPQGMYSDTIYVTSRLAFLALAAFAIGYLTTAIMARQQVRDHRIANLLLTTRTVSSTLKLPNLLSDLARCTAEALSAHGAVIRLIDESSGRLLLSASHGLTSSLLLESGPEFSAAILEELVVSGRPLIVHDARQDARFRHPQTITRTGIHSLVSVPILSRGRPLGFLTVYSREKNAFQTSHAGFVMKIAYLGATAIENALSYERLEHAGQERGMFVRMITHELRTPVASAQSLVKILLHGLAGEFSEKQGELLTRVDVRLKELMDLISDLLALASGRMPGYTRNKSPIRLLPCVRECVKRMSQDAASKRVEIELEVPNDELFVFATEDGMDKVFSNLISNAIKYIHVGGRIWIKVRPEEDLCKITVADNGIGIPKDDLPHIWDEFFRARNARDLGVSGTGLGLSIVKRFVELFGGVIKVESAEGEGTTFTLVLPLWSATSVD